MQNKPQITKSKFLEIFPYKAIDLLIMHSNGEMGLPVYCIVQS